MTVFSLLREATPRITYAIERGASEIDDSLRSDLDIVIDKKDFFELFELAQRRNMIIFTTLSFGGVRLFVSNHESGIKRIDFQWDAYYRGIPIADVGELLKNRTTDPVTGLFVLPESMHARIINAVKNAYGGADRYRELLSKHGYRVMVGGERLRWLAGRALSQPFSSIFGLVRTALIYLGRLVYPSGLMVYGADPAMLRNSRTLNYLFQGRIREAAIGPTFIHSRLMSELCVISIKAMADIDVSACKDIQAVEQKVVSFLRRKRSRLPRLLVKIT
jgi:hypothetical protein